MTSSRRNVDIQFIISLSACSKVLVISCYEADSFPAESRGGRDSDANTLSWHAWTFQLLQKNFREDHFATLKSFWIIFRFRKIKWRRNVPQTANSFKIILRKVIYIYYFLCFPKCCDANLMFRAAVTSPESVGACVCAAVAGRGSVCDVSSASLSIYTISTQYLHSIYTVSTQ